MGAPPNETGRNTMASFTLGTASQATGCAKSTILRAIRAGRISANRNENTQQWVIDPAELFRVFPALAIPNATPATVSTISLERDATDPTTDLPRQRAARRHRGSAPQPGRFAARARQVASRPRARTFRPRCDATVLLPPPATPPATPTEHDATPTDQAATANETRRNVWRSWFKAAG
jgi:hypothetical protein